MNSTIGDFKPFGGGNPHEDDMQNYLSSSIYHENSGGQEEKSRNINPSPSKADMRSKPSLAPSESKPSIPE